MRAAVYEGEGRLVVRDVPDPVPAPDEVLIEVEACGVCGSDVQIINVPPGHPVDPAGRSSATSSSAGSGPSGRPSRTSPIGLRVVVDPDPSAARATRAAPAGPANCTNIVALGVYRDGALAALRDGARPTASTPSPRTSRPSSPRSSSRSPASSTARTAPRSGPARSAVVFGAGAIGCLFIAVFRASGAATDRGHRAEPSTGRRSRAPSARTWS